MIFTAEQMKELARVHRGMDRGEIPYVFCEGHRMAVMKSIMNECGLAVGQSISISMAYTINTMTLSEIVVHDEIEKMINQK